MITNLGEIEKGKQKFSETIAKMQTDFQGQMDAIREDMDKMVADMDRSTEASVAAAQTGDSYAQGLRSQMNDVYQAGADLAKQANAGWKDYYIQRSPSKRAISTAQQTGESYARGLLNELEEMRKAGSKLAKEANDAYINATPDVTAFENVVNNSYGGNVNVKLNVNVNGKMTDREIQKTTDKMIYEIRKKLGRRI